MIESFKDFFSKSNDVIVKAYDYNYALLLLMVVLGVNAYALWTCNISIDSIDKVLNQPLNVRAALFIFTITLLFHSVGTRIVMFVVTAIYINTKKTGDWYTDAKRQFYTYKELEKMSVVENNSTMYAHTLEKKLKEEARVRTVALMMTTTTLLLVDAVAGLNQNVISLSDLYPVIYAVTALLLLFSLVGSVSDFDLLSAIERKKPSDLE